MTGALDLEFLVCHSIKSWSLTLIISDPWLNDSKTGRFSMDIRYLVLSIRWKSIVRLIWQETIFYYYLFSSLWVISAWTPLRKSIQFPTSRSHWERQVYLMWQEVSKSALIIKRLHCLQMNCQQEHSSSSALLSTVLMRWHEDSRDQRLLIR